MKKNKPKEKENILKRRTKVKLTKCKNRIKVTKKS